VNALAQITENEVWNNKEKEFNSPRIVFSQLRRGSQLQSSLGTNASCHIYTTRLSEEAQYTRLPGRNGADIICRNLLAGTKQLEHRNAHIAGANLHMYSTSIISPHLLFPFGISQQDERGDANDCNKMSLMTNNTAKKKAA